MDVDVYVNVDVYVGLDVDELARRRLYFLEALSMDSSAILVVDDDAITRAFLSDLLVHEGYDVSVAENGRKALEVLQGKVPDLIISDVLMPEMGGFELFKKVQEEDDLQNLPFIFLTALDDGDSMVRMKELGPDDFIQKPVRPRHVLASVKGKLRRKQRRDEKVERDQHQIRERIRWTLSHELRTPLTIIQSISELLLNETTPPQGKDYQELLKNLRAQSFLLGSLIENFLLVNRIDAGVEEDNWQKGAGLAIVPEAIEEAAFPFWDRARLKGVEFALDAPPGLPEAYVYRPHVLEILRQVLDNAFKFAAAGGTPKPRVLVRASAEKQKVLLTVSDNGPGINEKNRELLFQKLSQVDREVHEQQGSGLGLYITKRLVDVNRGEISLRSLPGQGVEIEIRLPTTRPAAV